MGKSVVLVLGGIATMSVAGPGQWATPRATVVFPDRTEVRVEVAGTPAARQRGLIFRRNLPETEGMLFVFEQPGTYPFWMQNCLIALDIIWLDSGRRVVSVAASVPPCRLADCEPPCNSFDCPTYGHEGRAMFVVEVQSGFAKKHGVKVGDVLDLRGLDSR